MEKISRRKAIQGAVATAFAYGAQKLPAGTSQTAKKSPKKKAILPKSDVESSLPVLAVWLALTARDHFSDFDPSTKTSAELANKLAIDMGIPTGGNEEKTIKTFIDLLRDPNTPVQFENHAKMYGRVHEHLQTLSAVLYPPGQCPKQYATLKVMAACK